MKIKKGDNVKIIAGKDHGKTGKVMEVFPKENRITIEGVNLLTRHRRPRKQGQKGEKVRVPMPINVSNAMLICGSCKSATRVGIKISESAGRVRVCKKCGSEI